MSTYILVKAGVVVNVALGDATWATSVAGSYDAVVDAATLSVQPSVGWTYSSGVFAYPGPTPAQVAAEILVVQTGILGYLSSSPINSTALQVNLAYLAAFVTNATVQSVPEDVTRMANNIATMGAFVGNASPTTADIIAALKAVCEDAVIVDRVALAVLADTIRYILQTSR